MINKIGFHRLSYLVLDVDGTMTDSGIYYGESGNELKRFSTRDGEAIKLARSLGIKIIVITGRSCDATDRRMRELNIDYYKQGVLDKYSFLKAYMDESGISSVEMGYIGDDINDIKAMSLAGFIGCPSDSCEEVKKRADYISSIPGGHGAVRDVIEFILKQTGEWEKAMSLVYGVERQREYI